MKTKSDIRKITIDIKKTTKSNGTFDQALLGLGVKITTNGNSK